MIDARHLVRFKQVTNEDLLVAGLIESVIDLSNIRNLLDIGAGTGLVSLALQRASGAEITVVDRAEIYDYPSSFRVIRGDWKDVVIDSQYDAVILSHVLGDFPKQERRLLLEKAISCVNQNGYFVSVENGHDIVFDDFTSPVFNEQGNDFDIDFNEVERTFEDNGFSFEMYNFKSYLPLGSSIDEAVRNSNLFFPSMFSAGQYEFSKQFVQRLNFGGRYALPVVQKIYVASHSPQSRVKRIARRHKIDRKNKVFRHFESFSLKVRYDDGIGDLIHLAKLDYVNPDVISYLFTEDEYAKDGVVIFKFCSDITSDEVEDFLKSRGYCAAGIYDMLRLIIEYPDYQRSTPIIALGSTWKRQNGSSLVPAVWGSSDSRDLNVCSRSTRWFSGDAFLAYRKDEHFIDHLPERKSF